MQAPWILLVAAPGQLAGAVPGKTAGKRFHYNPPYKIYRILYHALGQYKIYLTQYILDIDTLI